MRCPPHRPDKLPPPGKPDIPSQFPLSVRALVAPSWTGLTRPMMPTAKGAPPASADPYAAYVMRSITGLLAEAKTRTLALQPDLSEIIFRAMNDVVAAVSVGQPAATHD